MPRVKQVRNNNYTSYSNEAACVAKRALYTTAIGTAGAYFLFGEDGTQEFLSMSLPSSLAVGAAAGVGSVAGDLLSDMVIDRFDQSAAISDLETTSVKLGLSAAGTVATLQLASNVSPSWQGAALGAGSKWGGDAVYANNDSMLLGQLF